MTPPVQDNATEAPSAEAPSAEAPSAQAPRAQPKSPESLKPLRLRLRADAPKFPENFNPGIKALCVERDGQKMLVYHTQMGVLDFDTLKHQLVSEFGEEIDAGATKITERQVLTRCAICARISYCDMDYEGEGDDLCVGCWIVERSENGLGHIPSESLKSVSGSIHDLYYEPY